MAMFSSARLALRRSLAAALRAASPSLGAGLRQATEEPSLPRLLHGQLLPRFFASEASASNETSPRINKHFPVSGSEVAADVEMEHKRLTTKRKELISLLVEAVDTCYPAHRERVLEKHKEVQQVLQEYQAEKLINSQKAHKSDNGATRSKTADGKKSMSLAEFISLVASSILLGLTLSELESKLR